MELLNINTPGLDLQVEIRLVQQLKILCKKALVKVFL